MAAPPQPSQSGIPSWVTEKALDAALDARDVPGVRYLLQFSELCDFDKKFFQFLERNQILNEPDSWEVQALDRIADLFKDSGADSRRYNPLTPTRHIMADHFGKGRPSVSPLRAPSAPLPLTGLTGGGKARPPPTRHVESAPTAPPPAHARSRGRQSWWQRWTG